MKKVYITGHRNPDIDSICAAIAYARLKNKIDTHAQYIPVRCSHLNENAKKILSMLKINAPVYMRDVYPKVSDVMLTDDDHLDINDSLFCLAQNYSSDKPSAMPVYNNGIFYGLISVDDVTTWAMSELAEKSGFRNIPKIKDIMQEHETCFNSTDLFEDCRKVLLSFKKRGVAVFENNHYVGYVTRRCFLDTPKYDVILVDHNEAGQSIKGIEKANILEIIDHHRLAPLKTEQPIFIDAEPLGSTCTIIYQIYIRNGITIDCDTARVLLTGILSDTLILKSPTTTPVDIYVSDCLAQLCGVNVEEYGLKIFSNIEGLKDREPESAIISDFKEYNENNIKIGIGQCEVTTLKDLSSYENIYLESLESVKTKYGLNWAFLMITDVLTEHSILLITDNDASKHLPYTYLKHNIYDMPGVLSRKKQLLPEVLHAISII